MPADSQMVQRIDYVTRWRALVRAREDQGKRLDRLHGRADAWEGDRARRFRRIVTRGGAPDPLFELVRSFVDSRTTVLDVGAGPGRHTLPLARQAAHVTAVEPSPAMRAQLVEQLHDQALTNVTVISEGWPSAAVDPADVVICSHVAYWTAEIEPFVRRLIAVAKRRGFIVLRHTQRETAILDLFEEIWGEPRCLEPAFSDLFGVACQLGLWANVATVSFPTPPSFNSFEDAVTAVQADLLNPEGQRVERTIRDYLALKMVEQDGKWMFKLPATAAGVLWWEGQR